MSYMSSLARLGVCLLLVSVLLVGSSVAASNGQSPAGDSSDVVVGTALNESADTQTVVVRLADRPDTAQRATAASEQVGSLKSHATETQAPFERFASGNPHITIERSFWITNAVVVSVETDQFPLSRLGTVDNVERVHDNFELTRHAATSSQPAASPLQTTSAVGDYTWGVERIRAPDVWSTFDARGAGVSVAVLDTGVDPDHPDIDIDPANFQEFDADGNQITSLPYDSGTHGTHVSGTVVGGNASGQAIGVAPDATLYHGLVLEGGTGTWAQVIAGIEWATEQNVDVISASLGAEQTVYNDAFIDPIRNAQSSGTIVVASAGNEGIDHSTPPGNVYESISVGASTQSGTVTSFSSSQNITTADAWSDPPADWPAEYTIPRVVAPGVDVRSAMDGGGYEKLDGTSMAAPHVSGAIALYLSATDPPPPSAVTEQFETTAVTLDGVPSTRQGMGRIDVYNATITRSRATLSPTITPSTVNVSVPTELQVRADHPISRYHWSFPNGSTMTTTEPRVTHTFDTQGTQSVTLTLEDVQGYNTTTSAEVDVIDAQPPSARLTATPKQDVEVGVDTVVLNASQSTDNDGIANYSWAVGNDTTVTTTEPTIRHTYSTTGSVQPSVTVRDHSGNTNTTAVTVDVVDTTPPTAAFDAPKTVVAGTSATFSAANATDNHRIESFNWDLNGTAKTGETVSHTFSSLGEVPVALTVVDPSGNSNTTEQNVTVDPPQPTVTLSATPADTTYPQIGQANPAQMTVTAEGVGSSTTLAIQNDSGTAVRTWDLSASTGDGDAVLTSWNATGSDGSVVESGAYTAQATVVDEIGQTARANTSVTVDTARPVPRLFRGNEPHSSEPLVFNETLPVNLSVTDDAAAASYNGSITARWRPANYRLSVDTFAARTGWTNRTLAGADLAESGTYTLTATVVDAANNSNQTTALARYDPTPPTISTTITDRNATRGEATVRVHADEQLSARPTLSLTAPDGTTTAVGDELTEQTAGRLYNGTIEMADTGTYSLTARGADKAGNVGQTTTNTTVESVTTTDRTAVWYDRSTGTFIEFQTSADVSDTVTTTQTDRTPYTLTANQSGYQFLSSALGDGLATNLTNATIGVPTAGASLPVGTGVNDVSITYYNETTETWAPRATQVETVDRSVNGQSITGEYWLTTVETFSTYGTTSTDTTPPTLDSTTPSDGATLDASTTTQDLTLRYSDADSGVNASSVAFFINGTDVTDESAVTVTSEQVTYSEYPVSAGSEYTLSVTVADEAGNEVTDDRSFSVASPDSEKSTTDDGETEPDDGTDGTDDTTDGTDGTDDTTDDTDDTTDGGGGSSGGGSSGGGGGGGGGGSSGPAPIVGTLPEDAGRIVRAKGDLEAVGNESVAEPGTFTNRPVISRVTIERPGLPGSVEVREFERLPEAAGTPPGTVLAATAVLVPPQYESYPGRLRFDLSRLDTRSLDLASVDRSSVTVWHRSDGEWVARETQVVGDDDERLVIEASVPHFSYLVVTDTAAPPGTPAAEADSTATEADSETDTEATDDGIPGFGSGLAVIALMASGLVLAWRQLGRGDDTTGSHGDSSQ